MSSSSMLARTLGGSGFGGVGLRVDPRHACAGALAPWTRDLMWRAAEAGDEPAGPTAGKALAGLGRLGVLVRARGHRRHDTHTATTWGYARTASRITARGAGCPVNRSNASPPWTTSTSSQSTAGAPPRRAAATSRVSPPA